MSVEEKMLLSSFHMNLEFSSNKCWYSVNVLMPLNPLT